MTPYSLDFLRRSLTLLLKDGQKIQTQEGPRTLIPTVEWSESVHRNYIKRNAENAERQLGIPAELWTEVALATRGIFGYEKALEAMLLAGFTIGWVERGKADGKEPPK
jgi:hypothetical protein